MTAPTTAATASHTVTVKRTAEGWQIVQFKTAGMNKGETVLATFCGGMLGETLARQALKTVVDTTMPDEIIAHFED